MKAWIGNRIKGAHLQKRGRVVNTVRPLQLRQQLGIWRQPDVKGLCHAVQGDVTQGGPHAPTNQHLKRAIDVR